ncbi:hypothetical protein [Vibrio metschnikovii]|uniref:Uncharacterized protein n=1 Tax=Vibrio metschnikovii TaxID=28172 RepID=A0A9X0RB91_VIBME|nr:hypothetical protein [Vibrio metschnikovii]MBC5853164.1 hypothetical protein [Vibrio metschnikovii]
MEKLKILLLFINGFVTTKALENVSASFIANKVVAEVKNKYGSDFSCTLKELDNWLGWHVR